MSDEELLVLARQAGINVEDISYSEPTTTAVEEEEEDGESVPKFEVFYRSLIRSPFLTGNEVKVYFYLLTWKGESFEAFPPQKQIASETGLGERTIVSTIQSLEEKGVLWSVSRKYVGSNKVCRNLYIIAQYNPITNTFGGKKFKEKKEKYKSKKALVLQNKDLNGNVLSYTNIVLNS